MNIHTLFIVYLGPLATVIAREKPSALLFWIPIWIIFSITLYRESKRKYGEISEAYNRMAELHRGD